jgi:hypothetical protein
MSFLFVEAYWQLLIFDWCLARRDFSYVYGRVRNCPIDTQAPGADSPERICYAVDMAAIWYRREVPCLQRSAATTCLLRRHGVPAEMVIGAQQMPFKAHAWVEVAGAVVNDKPYTPAMYAVLDRF